ncbi:unnamed protein product, partial [Porites evermanni]
WSSAKGTVNDLLELKEGQKHKQVRVFNAGFDCQGEVGSHVLPYQSNGDHSKEAERKKATRNSGGLPLNGARQKAYPVLLSIVREGGFRGLEECKKQFKNEIWNCSLDQSKQDVFSHLPIFVKTTLPYATRETALLHAISNAAITHEVTLQCRQNKIPGCHCVEKNKHNSGNGEWQWGGCGDNIWFGENTTKSFIDVLEPQEESARRAVNLHNNEIGRR